MTAPGSQDAFLLRCEQLEVGYRGRGLLPAIDLSIGKGELWAVVGRNGSGKTSWIRTLLGLLPPVAGRVRRAERELRLSYLPQRQLLDDLYPLLVRDVVAMGLDRKHSFWWPRSASTLDAVEQALSLVDGRELARLPFRQLSEGQKQRVLFARLAAAEPDIAVLDEPTSAMDSIAEREAYELLRRLQTQRGLTLIVVSHFLGLLGSYANRALWLDRDEPAVVAGTPQEVLGNAAFRRRYTESMIPASA